MLVALIPNEKTHDLNAATFEELLGRYCDKRFFVTLRLSINFLCILIPIIMYSNFIFVRDWAKRSR